MNTPRLAPALKKHEILKQWPAHDRVHLTTRQLRPDLLEVRTTRGTLLGTYQRIEGLGWIGIS
jgi:hypothetical protein